MNESMIVLAARKNYLAQLEKTAEKQLEEAPEGKLRISRNRGKIQYFYRQHSTDKAGRYILQENKELAEKLAQKSYDEEFLQSIREETAAIDAYFRKVPKHMPEEIYDQMNEERRKLVNPLIEQDEAFAERWQNKPYTGKELDDREGGFLTDKGEKVRSKSEMIIANQLAKAGVPYHYEEPLLLKGVGMIHPDFTVLNIRRRKVFYWEHLGMMDDENYAERAIHRIAMYQKNGYFLGDDLILTSETNNYPIKVEQIATMIQHYFV